MDQHRPTSRNIVYAAQFTTVDAEDAPRPCQKQGCVALVPYHIWRDNTIVNQADPNGETRHLCNQHYNHYKNKATTIASGKWFPKWALGSQLMSATSHISVCHASARRPLPPPQNHGSTQYVAPQPQGVHGQYPGHLQQGVDVEAIRQNTLAARRPGLCRIMFPR